MTVEVARLTRGKRKKSFEEEMEITAWPSSMPEDLGSIAPPGTELSLDYEELGSRFLSDAVEQGNSQRPVWYDEYEETPFDPQLEAELLRSISQRPARKRTTTRPALGDTSVRKVSISAPRLPKEFEEFIEESGEIDLTEENIREASLLDHEGDEFGEIESPNSRTDDTHTHNKRRGGHAPSVRPARMKR
jgi:hypothetical protein